MRRELDRRTAATLALFGNTLLLAAVGYVLLTDAQFVPLRVGLYGLVWLFVGVAAVALTDPTPTTSRTKRRAAAVAVAYFCVLAYAGGVVSFGDPLSAGVRLAYLPPGWGPAVVVSHDVANVVAMPARVAGYLALSYLVYVTVIDAAQAAVSGLLGLLSCVSCTWPVLTSLAAGAFGAGSALATVSAAYSYDLSTFVFLVTVALLAWRPTLGGADPDGDDAPA